MELNMLYNMDCMEGMKEFPDKYFDLVIIDPPYSGLNSKSRGNGRYAGHHIPFDDMSERVFYKFIKPIFFELYRILKIGSHFYCFTDWKQMRNMADMIELSSFKIVNIICWDKGHFGTGSGYRSQSEYILLFSKGLPNIFNLKNIGNVIREKRALNSIHPHQKPENLIKKFILNSSNKNDIILDVFMGSGTTAISCETEGRNWIGFEIDKDFYKDALKRIENHKAQLKIQWKSST